MWQVLNLPWDRHRPHSCLLLHCLLIVWQRLHVVLGWAALTHLLTLNHLACQAKPISGPQVIAASDTALHDLGQERTRIPKWTPGDWKQTW